MREKELAAGLTARLDVVSGSGLSCAVSGRGHTEERMTASSRLNGHAKRPPSTNGANGSRPAPAAGRDTAGKFALGNKGGPGTDKRRRGQAA